jgi:hypothetical protein
MRANERIKSGAFRERTHSIPASNANCISTNL